MATSPQDSEGLEVVRTEIDPVCGGDRDAYIEGALLAVRAHADPDGSFGSDFVLVHDFRNRVAVIDPLRQHKYNEATLDLTPPDNIRTVTIREFREPLIEGEPIFKNNPEVRLAFNGLLNYRGHVHYSSKSQIRPGIRPLDISQNAWFMPGVSMDDMSQRREKLRNIMHDFIELGIAVTTGTKRGTIYAWSPFTIVDFTPAAVNRFAAQQVRVEHREILRERQAKIDALEAERQHKAFLAVQKAKLEKIQADREALAERQRKYEEERGTRRTPPPPVRKLVDTRAQQLLAEVRKSDERRSTIVEVPHELTEKEEKEIKRLIRSQRRNDEAFSPKTIERAVVKIICEGTQEVELPKLRPSDRAVFRKSIPVAMAKDRQPGWERRLKLLTELEAKIWPPVEIEE